MRLLDAHHKISKSKRKCLRSKVRVWSGVISSTKRMKLLTQESRLLWKLSGGDRIIAKSFWIGCDEEPRCDLERFAKECAAFHCPGSTYDIFFDAVN
jgi:hypothetical protein